LVQIQAVLNFNKTKVADIFEEFNTHHFHQCVFICFLIEHKICLLFGFTFSCWVTSVTDGWTDKMKLIVVFLNFVTRLKL